MLGVVPCSSIYSEPEANAGIAGGAGYGLMEETWSRLWQDSSGPVGASGCAFLLHQTEENCSSPVCLLPEQWPGT